MIRYRYKIYELSAMRLLSLMRDDKGTLKVKAEMPELIKEHIATVTLQNDCPIFFQALNILGKEKDASSADALSDVFIFMGFSGIYDRKPSGRILELQDKADQLFNPKGFQLDFGYDVRQFIAFERSASMSRNCRLSFVRADIYKQLKEHMMLGMTIRNCQLSKLYAYNGLMFTDGERFPTIELSDRKIIIADNPVSCIKDVDTVTVVDDGTDGAVRKYTRVENKTDIEVLEFDGEGIISAELAHRLNSEHQNHHSFQIRLPYIKGVVHEVDYKSLYAELGIDTIRDIFGEAHKVSEVEMIITKSMFKGFSWMQENSLSWSEYLDRCSQYGHALYVSGMDKTGISVSTELNYQFLNTLAFTEEEFRPKDLPLAWVSSPADDKRIWITKTTEEAYYNAACDNEWRIRHFTDELDRNKWNMAVSRRNAASLLRKNPLFINEKIYTDELDDIKTSIAAKYGSGQLIVSGDNRYLSDDLMRLLVYLAASDDTRPGVSQLEEECLRENEIFAPGAAYEKQETYTLLRSPHIARNEEAIAKPIRKCGRLRKKYLSHLTYVLMVDSRSLIPERLGGADYDGDMVKTIADPLVNRCVMRNYTDDRYLPLLKIPAADPLIADAEDWHSRLEYIKATFSSRIGQISNAALNTGILAYDESTDFAEKEKYRKDTETLAILTGLEIDSAKSGIKPDLSEYLGKDKAPRSLFLKYNSIIKSDDASRKWFQQTKNEKLKRFFEFQDWEHKSSGLEKLPYFAMKLASETDGIKLTQQPDDSLFVFASHPDWKESLNPVIKGRMKTVIEVYENALKRVRIFRHRKTDMKRRNDVERILYSRGQDEKFNAEALYSLFEYDDPSSIRNAHNALEDYRWHLVPPEERKNVYWKITYNLHIPSDYEELFCDFRNHGFRLLGDIICDIDESNRVNANGGLIKNDDSSDMKTMLMGVDGASDYRQKINLNCLYVLQPIDHKEAFDFYEAARCAVALGKRRFAIEVLGGYLENLVVSSKSRRKRWRLFKR